MATTASINKALPSWGSRGWRICASICMVLILLLGTIMTMSELLAGYHYWWYNLTLVIYAFAMFGLVLAVAEGLRAARNVIDYGLHPNRGELPELIEHNSHSNAIDGIDSSAVRNEEAAFTADSDDSGGSVE